MKSGISMKDAGPHMRTEAGPASNYATPGLTTRNPRRGRRATSQVCAGWSNYTYRAAAANLLGPTLWNEFVLGLLDAGECLIDDLHVVEVAGHSARGDAAERLVSKPASRRGAPWAITSAAGLKPTPIIRPTTSCTSLPQDPPSIFTTIWKPLYAGGRSVVNGRQYQVSFRAKVDRRQQPLEYAALL